MELPRNKIYFASDFHLGYPTLEKSKDREQIIVQWLDSIKHSAEILYLLGDIFDFWYEYKYVVPRGYVRFLGKLAELSDNGVKIRVFTGNHDVWMFDYLHTEIGAEIFTNPLDINHFGKRFYLHHGDALGNYDRGMNIIKKIFTNKTLQWFFSRIHPNFAYGLAYAWSHHSRDSKKGDTYEFLGEDKEWLILHSKEVLKEEHFDYFIYGHRHLETVRPINSNSTYVNLGTWLNGCPYVVLDENGLYLKHYKP